MHCTLSVQSRSVQSRFCYLRLHILIGLLHGLAGRNLGNAHAPPGIVAVGHTLVRDLDVEQNGNVVLFGILQRGLELVLVRHGVALAAVALGDLREVGLDDLAVEETAFGTAGETRAERLGALVVLQVFDAAPALVVEQHDVDLRLFLYRRVQLTVQHEEAAVTDKRIDVAVGYCQLGAERTADLVAHAREAVFHMVGVFALGLPQPLQTAGQRAGRADRHSVVGNEIVDDAERASLREAVIELNVIHAVDLFKERRLRVLVFGRPRALVIAEQRGDRVKAFLRVGEDCGGVHLERVERADVDGKHLHVRVLEAPFGAGREVGQTGADGDHKVGLLGDRVCRAGAGHAAAAHVQRMVPRDLALARLRFADGNVVFFRERECGLPAFGIGHAAADDHHRLLRGFDHLRSRFGFALGRQLTVDVPHALLQEMIGIVERFGLHVLRHGDTDRTGVGGTGQHTHRVDAGGHQLFGTLDAIPVFAHRAERIVGGGGNGVELLDLLQHRVGLTARERIAGQHKQRNAVRRGGTAGGDHVERTRADGRGAGDDLAAMLLLGIGDGGVRHALLIVSLIVGQVVTALFERLADTDHTAVTEDTENTFDELGFHAVKADILVVEEFDKGLRHGEFHSITFFRIFLLRQK